MIWNRVFKAIYLVIILGVTFGAYYFVQPYLESVWMTYQNVLGDAGQVQQVGSALPDLGKIFKGFGN